MNKIKLYDTKSTHKLHRVKRNVTEAFNNTSWKELDLRSLWLIPCFCTTFLHFWKLTSPAKIKIKIKICLVEEKPLHVWHLKLFPREQFFYSSLWVEWSGIRFPSQSYVILPEKSSGLHLSPMTIDLLQISSVPSSQSSSCSSFLQEIIFTIEWAFSLISLFIFERSLFSPECEITLSSSPCLCDFLALWWEAHRKVTRENTLSTAIKAMKLETGIFDKNEWFCMANRGLAMEIRGTKKTEKEKERRCW